MIRKLLTAAALLATLWLSPARAQLAIDGGEFGQHTAYGLATGGDSGKPAGYIFRKQLSPTASISFGIFAKDDLLTPKALCSALDLSMAQANHAVWLYTESGMTLMLPEGKTDPSTKAPGATKEQRAAIAQARALNPTKRLIYDGVYQAENLRPSPEFIAANAAYLRSLPIDGLTVYLKDLNDDYAGSSSISYRCFSSESISLARASKMVAPLIGVDLGHLNHNLVRLYLCPLGGNSALGLTKVDFYDDWRGVLANVRNVAKAAHYVGIKGFFIDNEDYATGWASYKNALHADREDLDSYQRQARLRGKQMAQAILEEMPEAWILLTVSPAIVMDGYELNAPFFAGVCDAVEGTR